MSHERLRESLVLDAVDARSGSRGSERPSNQQRDGNAVHLFEHHVPQQYAQSWTLTWVLVELLSLYTNTCPDAE